MSVLKASDVKMIKDWIDEHSQIFDCDCGDNGGYMEYDVNAYIHTDKCASTMQDHTDIVLTRLIEWIDRVGPISVRGW